MNQAGTRIRWRFLAVGAAAIVAAFACSPPQSAEQREPSLDETPASSAAAPALWRIADDDTTLYLFGTVHILPPGLVWRTPYIDQAFTDAETVYFETDLNPDPRKLNDFVESYAYYPPGGSLTRRLAPADRARLESAVSELGAPMPVIDRQRPWFAALSLAQLLIARAGYDPEAGVDRTLHQLAESNGKTIRRLETIEQQLLAFADLPEQVQIDYLLHGLTQIGEEADMLDDLVKAWRAGDVERLDGIMIEGELKDQPEVYEALMVRRNAAWTDTLDLVLQDEAGVFFIAVGAGHLAGEDSLQAMLAARGHHVERLTPP